MLISEEYYWDIANATEMGCYLTRKEMGLLDSFFQNHRGIKSCLDVGCGSGRFNFAIYDRGIKVVGLEKDLLPLHKLQNNGGGVGYLLSLVMQLVYHLKIRALIVS